ncbi:MAG: DNA repair protein RecO [Candidatus Omnitrophica bacterium]|nr:DNA repair protein RecO [Candidatus Omnitrophota bacterium]
MAIQKSESIVLRKRDFKETSAIIVLYTREFGKISGIVKEIKRPKSLDYNGGLEPFSYNRIVFYESSRSNLDKISQSEVVDYFDLIRKSLEKTAYASYLIELVDKFTELNDKNEAVFNLLLESLKALSVIGEGDNERLRLAFDVKLLHLSGFMPRLDTCGSCGKRLSGDGHFNIYHGSLICNRCIRRGEEKFEICKGTVASLNYIKDAGLGRVFRLKVTSGVSDEMTYLINRLILSHTGRNLKSLEFLEEIK